MQRVRARSSVALSPDGGKFERKRRAAILAFAPGDQACQWWASIVAFERASPKPRPSKLSHFASDSRCSKGLKMRVRSSGTMPTPVSDISTTICPSLSYD